MAELGVHQSALLTDLALCINRYRLFSPEWSVCVMAKVQLSAEKWEVPGLVAMVNYGRKKQCEVRDKVFHGSPNFVLDVFDFSVGRLGRSPHGAKWDSRLPISAKSAHMVSASPRAILQIRRPRILRGSQRRTGHAAVASLGGRDLSARRTR